MILEHEPFNLSIMLLEAADVLKSQKDYQKKTEDAVFVVNKGTRLAELAYIGALDDPEVNATNIAWMRSMEPEQCYNYSLMRTYE